MPGPKQRRHYKVQHFPPEVVEEVNALITAGHTYGEIVAHLHALGHQVSKSSVARYGQHFLTRYESLTNSLEMAKTIVASNGSTDLEEAATKIALDLILQTLIQTEVLEGDLDVVKAVTALARLQSSAVQREKWKADVRERAEKAAKEVDRTVKRAGLSDTATAEIRAKILGIVEVSRG